MPAPKIYRATELASLFAPVKPLRGNRKSAQAYVDRVTGSAWWFDHCPGYDEFEELPPPRVWVWEGPEDLGGVHDPSINAILNGDEFPSIVIGHGKVNGDIPALADKWVILHELAHVMTHLVVNDGHHGKQFRYAFVKLVREFLGDRQADMLIFVCKNMGVRMNYGLLLS